MKKKTTTDFLLEAKKIHGDKYDYSLVNYINNNSKINIICPIHGEFEQTPVKHLNNKQGCPKCSNIKTHNSQRKAVKTFIEDAEKIHGNKYDYSSVNYINNRTKIKIICPTHGEFEQTPNNHLKGKGCLYCGGTSKLDTNLFIKKSKEIHGDKYDYSLVKYKESCEKVNIICPEHGVFEQTPNNHLSKKQGCYKCLGEIHDLNSFIRICSIKHNGKYDYSLVNYNKITDNVTIICPIHGEFEQRCDSHRQGNGCVKCSNNGISKNEKEINNFLTNLNIVTKTNDKKILDGLELDIFIPSHNIAIEYNGLYWHSEQYVTLNHHLNKTELCEEQGIQLIHIFEDEWLFKQDIVKSRLKNLLGLNDSKIYGRKCIIKEVSSKDSKEFLNKNHIQGNVNSSVRLGLYYNNELVSLMTFGKGRIALGGSVIENSYELLRFCNKLNTSVIGGADKLLKHFIKVYNPKEIISYADRRWSKGDLYEKLGFNFIHNSKPNYFYIFDKKRKYRFGFRKDILIKQGFNEHKSEHEIMLERGVYRIYDCGNKKYIFKVIK
jgi:hypothetical protein